MGALIVFLLLLVIPLVEIVTIVGVAGAIGNSSTVLLLVLLSAAGAWFAKRQGLETLRQARIGFSNGRLPSRHLADGVSILLAGVLLLTPGFLTDLVGLGLLTPAGREAFGRWLLSRARRRVDAPLSRSAGTRAGEQPSGWVGFQPEQGRHDAGAPTADDNGGLGVDPDVIDVEWAEEAPVWPNSGEWVPELEPRPEDPSSF